jgi:hypothetical protein
MRLAAVADLEEIALRRDKRFVVRMVLGIVIGLAGGLFVFDRLTSEGMGSCAAKAFTNVAPAGTASPAQ